MPLGLPLRHYEEASVTLCPCDRLICSLFPIIKIILRCVVHKSQERMTRKCQFTDLKPAHGTRGRDTEHIQPHDNKNTFKVTQSPISSYCKIGSNKIITKQEPKTNNGCNILIESSIVKTEQEGPKALVRSPESWHMKRICIGLWLKRSYHLKYSYF